MNSVLKSKRERRAGRKQRIRSKVSGTAARPRVTVYFSNKNVFVQMIDDEAGKTLAAVSTMGKEAGAKGKNSAAAKWAGEALAGKAASLGVKNAVFDRNGYVYHGRVKVLAEAIREKGILM